MGGLMSVTGFKETGPVRAGLAVADMSAGLYAAIGILLALIEREQSGKGQWVHASLLHAQIAMMDFQGARYLNDGDVPTLVGNDHPTSSPMGLCTASDGVFNIGASGQGNWVRLCELLGKQQWLEDPRFKTEKLRVTNRPVLTQLLQTEFAKNTVHYWVSALNKAGVPAGPVYDVPQMFEDEQVKHLGVVTSLPDVYNKQMHYITQPMTLSRTPPKVVAPAPGWGEHTDEMLTEIGYTDEQIKQFHANGVV